MIVVDAPPLLPVSDPAILSRDMDGVVLVVRAGKTRRDVALRGKKILEDVGAAILGVIVNNADDVLPYYYGHSYYQYGYGQDDASPPRKGPRESKPDSRRAKERARRDKARGANRPSGRGDAPNSPRSGSRGSEG